MTLLFVVFCVGCSSNQSTPTQTKQQDLKAHKHTTHKGDHKDKAGHHHRHKRFVEPEKMAKSWNDPQRDTYQKPAEIIASMTIKEGMVVADLGTGTGYLLPHLSKAVGAQGKVLAQDIEPKMLAYVGEQTKKQGLTNIQTVKGTRTSTGFQPASVDRVVTLNVWHHISDREGFAKHLATTLKPGGQLIIVDFLAQQTEGFGPPLKMRLSEQAVIKELQQAGWKAEVAKETMPRHYIVRATPPQTTPQPGK